MPPPLVRDLPRTFLAALGGGLEGEPLQRHLAASTKCQNDVRRRTAENTGAGLMDLERWVCPNGRCRRKIDGVLLRPDGVHFSGRGAALAARWVHDRMDDFE